MDLRMKEVTVGTIVIVAILVFVFGTMWLSGRSVSSDNLIRVQFANVSGLKRASPVRISGVNVGKVERIEFMDVGKVLVTASLPPKIKPRVDATAMIVQITLVGDYAVDIDPGHAGEILPPGRIILGTQEVGLSSKAVALGDRADSVLVGAQAIVNQKTADQLYATMNALQATLKAATRVMEMYGNPNAGPSAEIAKTMGSLRKLTERLDTTLANPSLSRTLGRADTLTANLATMTAQLTSTSARLDTLLADISHGRGTIGKFATDSGFYYDIRALSQSMKKVLDELQKHPGKVPVTVKIF
jgi:phospholipid/cholesterol/gamma-HCH transport system substrate-binding protein